MNRLTLAGTALAIALGAVVTAELVTDLGVSVPDMAAAHGPSAPHEANADIGTAATAEDVRQIEARPLFNATRRPTHGDAASALLEATTTFNRRLTGVVIEPAKRAAIFAGDGGKRGVIVVEGGTIEGWLVAAVTPKSVTLRSATQFQVLELPRGKAGAVSSAPTATALSFLPALMSNDPDAPAPPTPAYPLATSAHP